MSVAEAKETLSYLVFLTHPPQLGNFFLGGEDVDGIGSGETLADIEVFSGFDLAVLQ